MTPAALRARRYRARRRDGRICITLEIDHVSVAEALVAAGVLDYQSFDDPDAIARALERVDLTILGVTRDATPLPNVLRLASTRWRRS